MDARRLAYLDAMGIDVWQPRREPLPAAAADTAPHIALSGGDGDILCIAHSAEESGLKLAADIARAMRSPPVWAWPSAGHAGEAKVMTVQGAVAQELLTRVLVFGEDLAEALFGGEAPEVIAGARVHVVPDLERLGRDREAKRILWGVMREYGIAAPRNPASIKT